MLAFTGSMLLVVNVSLGRVAGIAAGAGTLLVCVAVADPALGGAVRDRRTTEGSGMNLGRGRARRFRQGEPEPPGQRERDHDFDKLIKSHPS
ncbi:hypothetical protein ACWGQ5_18395 [Streptomyces sp. NPDC055722]